MRWTKSAVVTLALALAAAAPLAAQQPAAAANTGPARPFMIVTRAFVDGGTIPLRFSQAAPGVEAGKGTSPAIGWVNPPAGTRSFFIHMHDMEVARNKTTEDQVHWLVWNLPDTTTALPEGVPEGARLANGAYQISATGPMYRGPGAGAAGAPHHYVFEVYALDIPLDMPATGDAFETRTKLLAAIQGHVLGKAIIMGLFKRPM